LAHLGAVTDREAQPRGPWDAGPPMQP
jgi:hypothetical protein